MTPELLTAVLTQLVKQVIDLHRDVAEIAGYLAALEPRTSARKVPRTTEV